MERETSHSFDLWVTAIVSLSGSTQFSRGKEVHDHQGGFKQSATVNRLNVRDDASRCKTSPAALAPQAPRGHRLPLRKGNLHQSQYTRRLVQFPFPLGGSTCVPNTVCYPCRMSLPEERRLAGWAHLLKSYAVRHPCPKSFTIVYIG